MLYGIYNAYAYKIVDYDFNINKYVAGLYHLKLVFFSDLHLGIYYHFKFFLHLSNYIKSLEIFLVKKIIISNIIN